MFQQQLNDVLVAAQACFVQGHPAILQGAVSKTQGQEVLNALCSRGIA